jgi:hypothetical protein
LNKVDVRANGDEVIYKSAKNGYVDQLKWLASLIEFKHVKFESGFVYCTLHDFEDIAKWLVKLPYGYELSCEDMFSKACEHGHFEFAQRMLKHFPVNLRHFIDHPYHRSTNYQTPFITACRISNFEMAKWLYSLKTEELKSLYVLDRYMSATIMKTNNILLVQWLHSINLLTSEMIKNRNSEYFCWNRDSFGDREYVEWLYSFGGIDDNKKKEGFYAAVNHRKYDTAKWLYSIGTDVHYNNDITFTNMCAKNQLESVEFLLELDPIKLETVDTNLTPELYLHAFYLGYTPTDKMFAMYEWYKKRLYEELTRSSGEGDVTIFEIKGLPEIMLSYVVNTDIKQPQTTKIETSDTIRDPAMYRYE